MNEVAEVINVERVEAFQFNMLMTAGRTTPLLLTCERADGSPVEAIVKFATGQHCTENSLCAELIASQLAADLGLPTPTPLIVNWDHEFSMSIVDDQARQVVTSSQPPAFGSTFVTEGFSTWSTERKLTEIGERQTALATFFFDGLIGNSDRGGMKPNLLAKGDQIRLIDHEMAFQDFRLLVKPLPPWALGGFNDFLTPRAHIFATQLIKNTNGLDFDSIRGAWAGLSDAQIEAYESILPAEWRGANPSLAGFAVARIKECRNRIAECIVECKRVLNVNT